MLIRIVILHKPLLDNKFHIPDRNTYNYSKLISGGQHLASVENQILRKEILVHN